MHQILLQPQTPDELRLVKQFAKVMKIKAITVKTSPKSAKKQEILADLEQSVSDMKDYLSGKKTFKTAQQLLDEL
jgi:hypothetical protein